MAHTLYPLTFIPVYKDYPWGGDRIARRYQRPGTPRPCAESWEIADRPEGLSVVANGPLRGQTLHRLVETLGPRLLGTAAAGAAFPLLIKIIDARERLSLQVHPDEAAAPALGGEAKSEMWLALETLPGAGVFAGFQAPVTAAGLRQALAERRVEDLLRFLPLAAGDAVDVPAGRVHAIGAGCMLLEIQQNSNTTYRVHDWDRVGADGRPRDLHLAQALRATHWDDTRDARLPAEPAKRAGRNAVRLWQPGPWFQAEWLALGEALNCRNSGASFHALFIPAQAVEIVTAEEKICLPPGTSWLLPAALDAYRLQPAAARAAVVRISVPPASR